VRRTPTIPDSARGFFLLEALLTLILLAMIVGLFTSSMHLGQRMLAASRQHDQFAAFTAGIDAIARLLGRTVAVVEVSDAQPPAILVEGGPTRLALFTLSQGETNAGGLLATEMRFVHGRDGGAIELRAAPLPVGESPSLAGLGEGGGGNRATLVNHVHAAEFRFFGAKAGRPAAWHAAWNREDKAPALVSLRLRARIGVRDEDFEYTFSVGF
jgi:hypothetical protein